MLSAFLKKIILSESFLDSVTKIKYLYKPVRLTSWLISKVKTAKSAFKSTFITNVKN